MNLAEKYRPRALADVVGQPKAVKVAARLLGQGGRAIWIAGASGTGKTTLARILADSLTGGDKAATMEFKSADELTDGQLTHLEFHVLPYKFNKAIIVNEAHALKASVIRRLLGFLEAVKDDCLWVFTTTRDGEEKLFDDNIEEGPLMSRCIQIRLTNQGLAEAFAARVQEIAVKENMDGQPVAEYVKLARRCKNNCRAMLSAVESGEMAEQEG